MLFCPLASATTPDDVVARVAEALDLDSTESDRVLAALAARGPLLLVLDNLEQIPDVAVLIDGWLEALPQACILATSRIALGLPLETTVAVGPLDADSALRLFTDRALAARPDFSLDATNRALVEALVERLDRLSLALELAAARLAVLDLDRLTMELERRFRLLADPSGTREERHSALSTAIAWSVSLLSDDEQSAFAQLGVFRGGFTLEQAEAVLSVDGWAVDVLQNLVRASLVTRDGGRFGLLESVREYAEQQLDPPEPTWGRHWVCFSEMGTEAFQERLEGPEGPTLRLQVRDAPGQPAGSDRPSHRRGCNHSGSPMWACGDRAAEGVGCVGPGRGPPRSGPHPRSGPRGPRGHRPDPRRHRRAVRPAGASVRLAGRGP